MEEKTYKEKIFDELKKVAPKEPIQIVTLSKDLGCSISYVSSLLRHAQESGFVGVHENGSYMVLELPETYEEFQGRVNEKYEAYRNSVPSRRGGEGGRSRKKKVVIPKDFKIEKETVVQVISEIIEENNQMKDKIEKLIKYIKMLKSENDRIIRERNEILESIPID